MNEEPAWLRSDAAARTRKTEQDRDAPGGTPKAARPAAAPGLEAEASRALAAGQPEKLRPAAVMHLQRAAGNAGVAQLLGDEHEAESPVKEVVGHGAGAPLDAATRGRMEASFGADFSEVRVHNDGAAAASARAVDAHAYTVGNEVVLGDGQAPGSPAYERTLAHELTHVVQQRSGPVNGTPVAGGIRVSDPADPFEQAAESTADAVVGTGRASDTGAGGTAAGGSVQREEGSSSDEEEEIQALAIQPAGRAYEALASGATGGGVMLAGSAETIAGGSGGSAVQRIEQEEELEPAAAAEANRPTAEGAETTAGATQASATEGAGLGQPGIPENQQSAERAEMTAGATQASATEAARLEEQEEVQELAIQREAVAGHARVLTHSDE